METKISRFFLLLLFFAFNVKAQNIALSERIANYDIDVSLNPESKILTGKEKITWKNTSSDMINSIQLHMYMNAFKDPSSTFMKESGGRLRNDRIDKKEKNYGNIYLTSFKTSAGENLLSKMKFIQPDDDNEKDETVVEITLPSPIKPGESAVFLVDFRVKLPQIFARTGFAEGDYYLIGQWFPKMGVYEKTGVRYAEKGQWNCHQFHGNTEFYADFGVYNVNITIPEKFKVGATGTLTNTTKLKNGLKVLNFKANDVHDFAWTASPHFVEVKDKWKGVELIALVQPAHLHLSKRHFSSVKNALTFFDEKLGKYPFPSLTMVDPPLNATGSWGMEYPMFITCGYAAWGMPSSIRFLELVTIHEFGHQYFQGLLASNEFEESWLDEGFNTYFEWRIMKEYYPKGSQFDFFGFSMPDDALGRDAYVSMKNPSITPVFSNAWQYPKGTYSTMSYPKTGVWMTTLQNLLGEKVMDEVMKEYFTRFKFRHPSAKDFIAVVNDIAPQRLNQKHGENYDWYFDQALYKAPTCDYKVDTIAYNSVNKEWSFSLSRVGEFMYPQDITITYLDETQEKIYWDGKMTKLDGKRKKEIVSISLDTDRKNLMDLNFLNNSYTRNPSTIATTKYTAKVLFWAQRFLELFATWA